MTLTIAFSILQIAIVFLFFTADYLIDRESQEQKSRVTVVDFFKKDRSFPKTTLLQIIKIFLSFSAVLTVMWLLVKWGFLSFSMVGLFAILATGLAFVLAQYLSSGILKEGHAAVRLAIFPVCVVSALSWVLFPNWLTINCAAATIGLGIMVSARIANFYTAAVLGSAITIYDVVHVFGTKMMQDVAGSFIAKVPIMIMVPSSLKLDSSHIAALGLGDIIVPGIILMLFLGILRQEKRYQIIPLIGYALGLTAAYGVVILTNSAQPALIYLMPAIFIAFFIAKLLPPKPGATCAT